MNNNKLNFKFKQKWLIEHINTSFINDDYAIDLSTIEKKIIFFNSEIKRVSFYPYNLKKFHNNNQKIIADYLQGLPLTIPFYNNDILELSKSWGYVLKTENEEEEFISNYWNEVAMLVLQLFQKYNIKL